jgi:hypothetical protein
MVKEAAQQGGLSLPPERAIRTLKQIISWSGSPQIIRCADFGLRHKNQGISVAFRELGQGTGHPHLNTPNLANRSTTLMSKFST